MQINAFDPHVLAKALTLPLPGVDAQLSLAHRARNLTATTTAEAREAGVLILLYPHKGEIYFPLIQRTSDNPNDPHGGQISLPGGKREPSDESVIATAVREAQEEVGADPAQLEVLGKLSELYIPVSNFKVLPAVAFAKTRPDWVPQLSEVNRIIEAPLRALHHAEAIKFTQRRVGAGVKLGNVPYFDIDGEVVWGATAMMLSELRQLTAYGYAKASKGA